jgi:predicted ArsR family transcriptional regulator
LEIKRSSGLAVGELAERLGMSYMGAKQHCLHLEKKGLLDSRNEHRGQGRPLLVYRLTRRAQGLFAGEDCRMTISVLKKARDLFGPAAPGKILYAHFQELATRYREKVQSGEPARRLELLAELRDEAGCMARIVDGNLVEYHCPWQALFEAFPEAIALEESMLTKVVGVTLKRRVSGTAEHYEVRFEAFRCVSPAG